MEMTLDVHMADDDDQINDMAEHATGLEIDLHDLVNAIIAKPDF